MTQSAVLSKEDIKKQKDAKIAEDAAIEMKANEGRTGKGTRVTVGWTRGQNSQRITYEAFDESQPDTLPTTLKEFVELTKMSEEKAIVACLIDGFNSQAYTNASDPIAEYIDPAWDAEKQAKFRLVVRNFAAGANVSLDEAVALIKPGFEKASK